MTLSLVQRMKAEQAERVDSGLARVLSHTPLEVWRDADTFHARLGAGPASAGATPLDSIAKCLQTALFDDYRREHPWATE